MEKHQYICPKCGCQQYESDRLQATGGNFAKIFDIQNKKFVTISCCNCGYTELYRQTGSEGCLSVPGKSGVVTRPDHVKVKAFDCEMNEFELIGEGLLARAICHECDHLSGDLFVDKVEGELTDVDQEEDETEEGDE